MGGSALIRRFRPVRHSRLSREEGAAFWLTSATAALFIFAAARSPWSIAHAIIVSGVAVIGDGKNLPRSEIQNIRVRNFVELLLGGTAIRRARNDRTAASYVTPGQDSVVHGTSLGNLQDKDIATFIRLR